MERGQFSGGVDTPTAEIPRRRSNDRPGGNLSCLLPNNTMPSDASEPTIAASIWRHRRLVIACAGVGLILAILAIALGSRNPSYRAIATIEVADPTVDSLFASPSNQNSARYVANQIEILRSFGVASRAAELAVEPGGSPMFTVFDVASAANILPQPGTDVITISFIADEPARAVEGANSVAEAYQQIRSETLATAADATLRRIDNARSAIDEELAEVESQINSHASNLGELNQRVQTVVNEILEVQVRIDTAQGTELEEAVAQLQLLRAELESLELVRNVLGNDPGLTALLQSQDRLIQGAADLDTRRLEVEIDQDQMASSLATYSPASLATLQQSSRIRTVMLGLIIGTSIGSALAVVTANARRVILEGSRLESILNAVSLGEIPDFTQDGVESNLPIRDHPRSASAEAFRFASTGLEAETRARGAVLIAVVSSESGDGKSIVVTNTAIAAAYGSRRVLIVDADFGNQKAGLTLGVTPPFPGLTDIVAGHKRVEEVLLEIPMPGEASVSYLGRGTLPAMASDFFNGPAIRGLLTSLRGLFDLVLIDTPPLLQVAYGATVARLTDGMVAVVKHGCNESQVLELGKRLRLLDVPLFGYVYNQAPLKPTMTRSEGSMKDIIGDSGFLLPVGERRPTRGR